VPKEKNENRFTIENEQQVQGTWEYSVLVLINSKNFGRGKGGSKKQAEQQAAKQTLELIGEI